MRDQTTRTGVGDQLGQQFVGLAGKVRPRRREHELERKLTQLLDRFDLRQPQCGFARQKTGFVNRRTDLAAGDYREEIARVFLEFVERGATGERECHLVRRVVLLVKCSHRIRRCTGQSLLRPGRKFALPTGRIVELTGNADESSKIVLHVPHGFVVHRVNFAPRELGVELRSDEELREAIQRAGKRIMANFEVIVRVIGRGVGVVHAAIGFDEAAVFAHVRILFRPKKKHVLEKMRHAFPIPRIVDLADAHHQRGTGFVELRIRNQEDAQSVIEYEAAENRLVGRRFDSRR